MRHKYNAKRTVVDGVSFDSKKEAERYEELKFLEKGGIIRDLELQPKFILQAGFYYRGSKIREISYIADFMYYDNEKKRTVVEDVKGFKTDVYKLKKKLFLKNYPDYEFVEI